VLDRADGATAELAGFARQARAAVPAVVLGLVLAAGLQAVAILSAPSISPLGTRLWFSVLYATLGVGLVCWLTAATRIARPLGLVVAVGVGALLTWQVRENFDVPVRKDSFAALSVGVGIVLFLIVSRFDRRTSPLIPLLVGTASLALLAAAVVATFEAGGFERWRLLRHHKLFGTPAYYLLAQPVGSIRAELWAERASAQAPPAAPIPPESAVSAGARPNLVFVLVDTLRADGLAVYGGPPDLMPELNAIAAQSLVFQNVLANATWTRPSVASLFTGLLPEEHGAVDRGDALSHDRVTLAELLSERGYTTAAFVSNFGAVGRSVGFAQGFQEFREITSSTMKARAEQVNQEVADWLASRRERSGADAPVFLYVHYLDPHAPYLSGGPLEPKTRRQARQGYLAELRYFDQHIRRLVDRIDQELGGTTYVFLTSDHGAEFGEHGEGGHGHSLYPEVLHLPALLRTPSAEVGTISEALEERDFFELLLRLAESPALDVRQWARHAARDMRYASIYSTTTLFGFQRPYLREVAMRAVEQGGAMAIWSGYGPTYELYDLERDPGARVNLVEREPDRLERMRRTLDELPAHWSRPVPVDNLSSATEEQLRALGYIE
jgi:arylsulfatase A-like enzyme